MEIELCAKSQVFVCVEHVLITKYIAQLQRPKTVLRMRRVT